MKYISRKILILIITILFITLLTFLAFHVLPGDPAQLILGTEASPEKVEALREQLGTNQPLLRQYTSWISGFARADFGTSLKYQKPVAELIAGRLPVTLLLGTMVIVLTLAVGIPLGVFAARKQGTWIEQGVSLESFCEEGTRLNVPIVPVLLEQIFYVKLTRKKNYRVLSFRHRILIGARLNDSLICRYTFSKLLQLLFSHQMIFP